MRCEPGESVNVRSAVRSARAPKAPKVRLTKKAAARTAAMARKAWERFMAAFSGVR